MRPIIDMMAELRQAKLRIWAEGDQVRYQGPKGALTPGLLAELRGRKTEVLEFCRRARTGAGVLPLGPAPDGATPISLAQHRLWVLDRMEGPSPAYNIPLALRLKGALDADALRRSAETIVQRHAMLRTAFKAQGDTVHVELSPACPLPWSTVDLRHLPGGQRLAEVRRQAGGEALRPFDLTRAPLIRFALWTLGDEDWVVMMTMHHIVSDGRSIEVLAEELAVLYQAYRAGGDPVLPDLPVRYSDFAWHQRRWLSDTLLQGQLDYWRGQLAGLPPLLELPVDRPRPTVFSSAGATIRHRLDGALVDGLKLLARQSGATPYMVLLAVGAVVLARYTGSADIPIACPATHRNRPELDRIVGFFVNSLVLRFDLSGDPPFMELLRRTRAVAGDAFANQDVPFDKVVEALQVERNSGYPPLAQVSMVMLDAEKSRPSLDGLETEPFEFGNPIARYDVSLEMYEAEGTIDIFWIYRTDLFAAASVQAIADSFAGLLETAVASPGCPVGDLPAVTPAQRAALLALGRGPDLAVPECGLFELIEAQARRTPDRRAVADQTAGQSTGQSADLSYAGLIQAAEIIAARLQRLGAGPGSRVGLMLERGAALPAAVLGILRTGAAYVPLDPGFPAERLAYAAADAGIGALLTQASLSALWPPGVPVCRIDDPAPVDLPPAPVRTDPAACAYILYTSGSTGRPKGVRIAHRSVVSFLLAMRHELGMKPDARLLAVTTIGFDIAVLELLLPLTLGACTVICDRETAADGRALARRLAASGADWMQATPATWRLLLDAGWPGQPNLTALCGGEALPAGLAAALLPVTGALWNLYGPTETTVWSTCGRVEPGAPVTLGRPIANTRLYVLDGRGRLVPPGVAGELHIGGAGVALDYAGRPDLTADRFLAAPAADPDGGRVYRTGDRVRWSAAGRLHYLGRFDHQIKLRGYRIEPGEIEAVLSEHPGVGQAAVVAVDAGPDKRLTACVTPAKGAPTLAEARDFLRRLLPDYMLPETLLALDEFPLTPNGKIDRAALVRLEVGAERAATSPEPPETAAEIRLAEIWAGVLVTGRVGRHDRFIALGGHSLLATRIIARVQDAFGVTLPVRLLFEEGTVAAMAAALEEARRDAAATAAATLRSQIDRMDPAQIKELLKQKRAAAGAGEQSTNCGRGAGA